MDERSGGPYEQYRAALGSLRDDAAIVALVDAVGAERGWWPAGRAWRREYGRFDVGADPPVTLLFETAAGAEGPQELCSIDVWSRRTGDAIELAGVGWLTFRRFPDDAELPWLADAVGAPGAVSVLRYRPGKRCTMRVDPADGSGARFVKVFDDSIDGAAMHAEGEALSAAAARGELGFAVAPSLGWQPALRAHSQGTVPGVPAVGVLFGPAGAALASRMGAAAATLTTSSLRPSRRTGYARQMKRSRKYAGRIAATFPELRAPLDELLAKIERLHTRDDDARARPIHGAPHPHQWLLDGDRLGLVDFDGFAIGPPELDLATFVTEMEYEDASRVPIAAIVDAFRAGYESVAGALDDDVLAAYVAHKRLAKAQRNTRAVRDDNDVRTAAAIEAALAAASGGR